MLSILALTAIYTAARGAYLCARRGDGRRCSGGTLVDAVNAESVQRLVRLLDQGRGADALVARIERVLSVFPPSETIMRRLSLMQQAYEGEGGAREYAVACVYMVATKVVLEGCARAPRKATRARSAPPRYRLKNV